MLIDKKVDRYVRETVSHLPPKLRARASRELTDTIMDLISDRAGRREPDILDAREVIRGLGKPEDMAESYLMSVDESVRSASPVVSWFREHFRFLGNLSLNKANHVLHVIVSVCTVLALVLVVFGLLALGTGVIHTMLPVFIGCMLALIPLLTRGSGSLPGRI